MSTPKSEGRWTREDEQKFQAAVTAKAQANEAIDALKFKRHAACASLGDIVRACCSEQNSTPVAIGHDLISYAHRLTELLKPFIQLEEDGPEVTEEPAAWRLEA